MNRQLDAQLKRLKECLTWGNLSLNRYISFCEIVDAILNLGFDVVIDVYGHADPTIAREFLKHKNIKYHGFIDYSQAEQVMQKTDVLLHVENFDSFFVTNTKYGFFGIIADLLNSGKLVLVYAPESISFVQYMLNNNVCVLATSKSILKEKISEIMTSQIDYDAYVRNELALANKSHNLVNNSSRFSTFINSRRFYENN